MWVAGVVQSGLTSAPDIVDRRRVFGTTLTRKLQPTGIQVLGVRYHSAELHRSELQRKTGHVELRWHPDNIGAISVRRRGGWLEVGAVMQEFHGLRAVDWLAAVAVLRSDRATTEVANRDTIRAAFEAIADTNGSAMKRANIIVPNWSDQRIAAEEARLFIGFRVAEDPATAPVKNANGLAALSFDTGPPTPSAPTQETETADQSASADLDAGDNEDDHDWEIRE